MAKNATEIAFGIAVTTPFKTSPDPLELTLPTPCIYKSFTRVKHIFFYVEKKRVAATLSVVRFIKPSSIPYKMIVLFNGGEKRLEYT